MLLAWAQPSLIYYQLNLAILNFREQIDILGEEPQTPFEAQGALIKVTPIPNKNLI